MFINVVGYPEVRQYGGIVVPDGLTPEETQAYIEDHSDEIEWAEIEVISNGNTIDIW